MGVGLQEKGLGHWMQPTAALRFRTCPDWAWPVGQGGLRLLQELCQVAPGLGMWLSVSSPSHSPGPRLVFNRVNGRRPPATSPSFEGTQEPYTLAHEENVRFVSEGNAEARGSGPGHWSPSHCNLNLKLLEGWDVPGLWARLSCDRPAGCPFPFPALGRGPG